MPWGRPGTKPLSEPMMSSLPTHICIALPQLVNIENTTEGMVIRHWKSEIVYNCSKLFEQLNNHAWLFLFSSTPRPTTTCSWRQAPHPSGSWLGSWWPQTPLSSRARHSLPFISKWEIMWMYKPKRKIMWMYKPKCKIMWMYKPKCKIMWMYKPKHKIMRMYKPKRKIMWMYKPKGKIIWMYKPKRKIIWMYKPKRNIMRMYKPKRKIMWMYKPKGKILWMYKPKRKIMWMYKPKGKIIWMYKSKLKIMWMYKPKRKIYSFRHQQNEWQFWTTLSKCVFFKKNLCILIQIALKFILNCPINNNPALIWYMCIGLVLNK